MSALLPLFEGPEKKLEIILSAPRPDIRPNPERRWNRVVAASRAEIISSVSTPDLDAYLLSESSLFVWKDRVLMITCGKTTLVAALPEILSIVGKENVAFVFYEQKNFLFPEEQPSTFKRDVNRLMAHFPGKYYTLGPGNYDHMNVFYSSHETDTPEHDATLQILMHGLDPEAMACFWQSGALTPDETNRRSGLDRIYPTPMVMDGFLFSPCGYSLNGVHGAEYFTVHVTPQQEGSYVSFETNIFETHYGGTIERVVSVFRPERFSLMLTTSMDADCRSAHHSLSETLSGYWVTDKSFYELDCGYGITFLNHRKR